MTTNPSVNAGTHNKEQLQTQALKVFKENPRKTLSDLAYICAWDMHITYRTALESYVMPCYKKGILIDSGDNLFCLSTDIDYKPSKPEINPEMKPYLKAKKKLAKEERNPEGLTVKGE